MTKTSTAYKLGRKAFANGTPKFNDVMLERFVFGGEAKKTEIADWKKGWDEASAPKKKAKKKKAK